MHDRQVVQELLHHGRDRRRSRSARPWPRRRTHQSVARLGFYRGITRRQNSLPALRVGLERVDVDPVAADPSLAVVGVVAGLRTSTSPGSRCSRALPAPDIGRDARIPPGRSSFQPHGDGRSGRSCHTRAVERLALVSLRGAAPPRPPRRVPAGRLDPPSRPPREPGDRPRWRRPPALGSRARRGRSRQPLRSRARSGTHSTLT